MTDITIDGETFRVEVEGLAGRPAILLSSSLGSDLSLWDAQMPALLERFRVIRYDPRGHGRSTTAGAPYSLARLGTDVLAILDALEIQRVHFLGISMGGAVGQWLLVNAPERIDRAVLANTSARFGPPELWNERIRTVLADGTQALATATMERWFSNSFHRSGAGAVARIAATFRATSAEGYAASCAALRDMDLRAALRGVERPVLIVTGHDDPAVPAAEVAAMLDAIAGARHVALACRHISNIEAQAAFDATVIDFLTAPIRAGARARGPAKATAGQAARRPARSASTARTPLKPARAPVASARRRSPASAARTGVAPVPAEPTRKSSSGKAAGPSKRSASPVGARATARSGAAGTTAPARKAKPVAKTTSAKPRRGAATSAATRKAIATRTAEKTAVEKTAAKKPVAKKAAATKTARKALASSAARRPAKKPTGRPGGRGRR